MLASQPFHNDKLYCRPHYVILWNATRGSYRPTAPLIQSWCFSRPTLWVAHSHPGQVPRLDPAMQVLASSVPTRRANARDGEAPQGRGWQRNTEGHSESAVTPTNLVPWPRSASANKTRLTTLERDAPNAPWTRRRCGRTTSAQMDRGDGSWEQGLDGRQVGHYFMEVQPTGKVCH